MFFKKGILVVHGFAGNTSDNERLVNFLQTKFGYDVFSFTLPGHEKSYISGVKHAEWIKASEMEVDELLKHYSSLYVVGHSMGGVIATHLASKYKQIKKLILLAPAFEYISINQNRKDIPNISKLIANDGEINAYELILSKLFLVPIPTVIEFIKLVKRYKDIVKEVNIPTLIIHGNEDEVIPIKSSEYAYSNINTNKKYMTIFKGVRHGILRSKREKEISAYIYKFCRGGLRWKRAYKSTL